MDGPVLDSPFTKYRERKSQFLALVGVGLLFLVSDRNYLSSALLLLSFLFLFLRNPETRLWFALPLTGLFAGFAMLARTQSLKEFDPAAAGALVIGIWLVVLLLKGRMKLSKNWVPLALVVQIIVLYATTVIQTAFKLPFVFLNMFFWNFVSVVTEKSPESRAVRTNYFQQLSFFVRAYFPMPLFPQFRAPTASQKGGFRLLFSGLLILSIMHVLNGGLTVQFGDFTWHVPQALTPAKWNLTQLFRQIQKGVWPTQTEAWIAVYANFLLKVLFYVGKGNVVIGTIRLCGFSAFRNTYRLSESKSIFDFFQRYSYYFKELLNEFFFTPAFFFLRKVPLHLRFSIAILFSVGVGNFLFHLSERLCETGLDAKVDSDLLNFSTTYSFYCAILCLSILGSYFWSHFRAQPRALRYPWQMLRFLAICHIFVFLKIFETDTVGSLALHLQFVRFLFFS